MEILSRCTARQSLILAPHEDVTDIRNWQNSAQQLQTGEQRAYSVSMGVGSEESVSNEAPKGRKEAHVE